MQCATMKYEIIRKPLVIERVKVISLKSEHYYKLENLEMIPKKQMGRLVKPD